MTVAPRHRVTRLGLVTVLALGAAGCPPSEEPGTALTREPFMDVSECPHYWSRYYPPRDGDTLAPLSGHWVDIPEYNDCQRLTTAYSPDYSVLGAVFASQRLDRLLADLAAANAGGGNPKAVAAATLVLIDGPYGDLGLHKGANCLYLYQDPDGSWAARTLPVPGGGGACNAPLDLVTGGGLGLGVRTDPLPSGAPPALVARWERDKNGAMAVGVQCGQEWCTVMSGSYKAGTAPGVQLDTDLQAWLNGLPNESPGQVLPGHLLRLALARGWVDEQWLAPATGPAVPSPLWGVVIPHPRLGTVNQPSHYDQWRVAAYVHIPSGQGSGASAVLSGYTSKFDYRVGWNAIALCRGGAPCAPATQNCAGTLEPGEERWFARVYAKAAPGTFSEFCVRRIPHGNLAVAGTARWRWRANDETVWTRCVQGCCEVEDRN